MSLHDPAHCINPIPLLERERYIIEIYIEYTRRKSKKHFSDLCFWFLCGSGNWGKELLPTNKTILCYSILFYFILEAELRLRQPILETI